MSETPTPCICAKVRRASRTLTAMYDEVLAPFGLTTPQLTLLSTLARRGPLSLSALAKRTGHDRSTLNRSMRPLEAEGLVAKAPGIDRRERRLAITSAGETAVAQCTRPWEIAQKRVGDTLGADSATLVALLDRIEELRA